MPNATVVFHRLAARDYREALRWYARRSAGAAQRFRVATDNAIQRIANAPPAGEHLPRAVPVDARRKVSLRPLL